MKLDENRQKGSGDMEQTWNSSVWVKLNENHQKGSGDMEQTWNSSVNPLTFSLGSEVMCSAHHLTKRYICVKFNENCLKGSGDMKRHKIQG